MTVPAPPLVLCLPPALIPMSLLERDSSDSCASSVEDFALVMAARVAEPDPRREPGDKWMR